MSQQRHCVKCSRAIDEWAKLCPFCNWDQSLPAPPPTPAQPIADAYKPPEDRDMLRKKLGFALAGVLLLLTSFAIGMVINKDDAPKNAPEPVTEQAASEKYGAARRADTPLVPAGEGGFEQPFTSAPATEPTSTNSTATPYDRSDATAVSSAEYTELAKRAAAERQRTAPPLVDPRSLGGAAYAQGERVPARRPPTSSASAASSSSQRVARTRPVPQHQPVPQLRATGTAKLDLVIGPDGRVQSINVRQAVRGGTPAIVAAVQRWRFKPATVNGRPVSAPYSVEISYGNR